MPAPVSLVEDMIEHVVPVETIFGFSNELVVGALYTSATESITHPSVSAHPITHHPDESEKLANKPPHGALVLPMARLGGISLRPPPSRSATVPSPVKAPEPAPDTGSLQSLPSSSPSIGRRPSVSPVVF